MNRNVQQFLAIFIVVVGVILLFRITIWLIRIALIAAIIAGIIFIVKKILGK